MHICITTDGSARSLRALPHAALLAQATGATLTLGHVIDPSTIAGRPDMESIAAEVYSSLADAHAALRATLADYGVTGETAATMRRSNETVPETLARLAAESGADLAAMDTHGAGPVRHALFGSTAMGFLGHTGIPLFVVGPEAGPAPVVPTPYRILVTSDGSDASRAILPIVQELSDRGATPVFLRVHVPRIGDMNDERMAERCDAELAEFARDFPGEARTVRVMDPIGGVDRAITAAARELNVRAIAMATHGHSASRHLLAGSVALGVIGRSGVPVLAARTASR